MSRIGCGEQHGKRIILHHGFNLQHGLNIWLIYWHEWITTLIYSIVDRLWIVCPLIHRYVRNWLFEFIGWLGVSWLIFKLTFSFIYLIFLFDENQFFSLIFFNLELISINEHYHQFLQNLVVLFNDRDNHFDFNLEIYLFEYLFEKTLKLLVS